MDRYRSRLKLSENSERHWSILTSGEIHMDQSLVHTFSWGNSYAPMVLKVFLKFPVALPRIIWIRTAQPHPPILPRLIFCVIGKRIYFRGSRRKTSGEVWGTSGEVRGLPRSSGEPDSLPATRQICLQLLCDVILFGLKKFGGGEAGV